MTNSGFSKYTTFTAESFAEYEIMKNTKLSNNARRSFNDEKMTCQIDGKYNAMEFDKLVSKSKPHENHTNTEKPINRLAVAAGTVQVGDILIGRMVTGLGKWFQPNNDDFYSVNGIAPDADYVQYAYFDMK
jgi:hypothetical protein